MFCSFPGLLREENTAMIYLSISCCRYNILSRKTMFRIFKRRTDSSDVEQEPEKQETQLFALAEPEPDCITVPLPDSEPDPK
jgi:hypothetical protein